MTFPKALIPVVVLIVLILGVLFAIKSTLKPQVHGGAQSTEVGTVLPDFQITEFEGKAKPISELKAKLIFVNFWAMWCSACIEEMPSIIKFANRYKNDGVHVVAVNLDPNPEVEVPKSRQQFQFPFPIFYDKDQNLSDLFDIHGLPFTMILDANRKVLYTETGERDWNDSDVHEQMKKWLGQ